MSTFTADLYQKGYNEVMDAIEEGSGVRLWGKLLKLACLRLQENDLYRGMLDALTRYEETGRTARI